MAGGGTTCPELWGRYRRIASLPPDALFLFSCCLMFSSSVGIVEREGSFSTEEPYRIQYYAGSDLPPPSAQPFVHTPVGAPPALGCRVYSQSFPWSPGSVVPGLSTSPTDLHKNEDS